MKNQFNPTNPLINDWVSKESGRLAYVLSKIGRKSGLGVLSSLDTAIKLRDASAYLKAELDPRQYESSDYLGFAMDLFRSEVLSKSAGFFPDQNPDRAGYLKFIEAENICRETNYRLANLIPERDVEECSFYIRRKIDQILGDVNSFFPTVVPSWGPGVTKTIRGQYHNLHKLAELPLFIPPSAWKLYSDYLSQFSGYVASKHNICAEGKFCLLESEFSFDDVAKVTAVPKTFKTSRPITVEPTCLVSITKAYGSALRRRLARYGVDLTDQTVNRRKALDAIRAGLATVDLKSASDCMSIMAVQLLFSQPWTDLLFKLRSARYVCLDSLPQTFEKFAGMGNAITFPLESLIFYSITCGVHEYMGFSSKECSVYGDDIICRSEAVPLLKKVLRWYGFIINDAKTHYRPEDLYRESCGIQAFNGIEVTPPYIKGVEVDYDTCLRNHNRLFRWLARLGLHHLIPILGSLRNKDCQLVVVDPWDLPQEDKFFFALRGDIDEVSSGGRRETSFMRVKSIEFLSWLLCGMEARLPSRASWVSNSGHIIDTIGYHDVMIVRIMRQSLEWGTLSYSPSWIDFENDDTRMRYYQNRKQSKKWINISS